MKFPLEIQVLLRDKPLQQESVGLSGAGVWMCQDLVLKAEPQSRESDTAAAMMTWLRDKLPVPQLRCRVVEQGMDFQLMTRLPGSMACDPVWMTQPEKLAQLLAQALKLLWSVDVSDCPCSQSLDNVLEQAALRVQRGRVDPAECDPATFGPGAFVSPEHLLRWLLDNKPPVDPVLSHGDLCLPNILIRDGQIAGFIDLGRAGVCDRYQDIALCWRSMRDNFGGRYGASYPGFREEMLFEALGIRPDWHKLHYYRLLDELF